MHLFTLQVIEIESDDEIMEIPKETPVLSKMELLNLIPNISSQAVIKVNVDEKYIPPNITPMQKSYSYDRWKLLKMPETDKNLMNRNQRQPYYNQNNFSSRRGLLGDSPSSYQMSSNNYSNSPSFVHQQPYSSRFGHPQFRLSRGNNWNYPPSPPIQGRVPGFFARPTGFFNFQTPAFLRQQAIYNNIRNFVSNFFKINRAERNPTAIELNDLSNSQWTQQRDSILYRDNYNAARNRDYQPSNQYSWRRVDQQQESPKPGKPSFAKNPSACNWAELKLLWREEKTITIDDDQLMEQSDYPDSDDIEVVEHLIKPLINVKNFTFGDIYEKLRIIKHAPEKTVRRKKDDYKISYSIYNTNQQPFKKANPGPPMFRMAVIAG